MDGNIRPCGPHRAIKCIDIEDVDNDKFDAFPGQILGLRCRTRRTEDPVAGLPQERCQARADRARGACEKSFAIGPLTAIDARVRTTYQSSAVLRNVRSHCSIPGPGEGKRGEQGHLGYLLRQASGAFRLRLERALADLEVTHPQFAVLTMLSNYPGLSNADLARLALLTPQTVSVIVSNLERGGALRRRPHPVHGRIQHIELSEKGNGLLLQCRERVPAIELEIADGLTAKEEEIVRRWLVSVAAPAKETKPSRSPVTRRRPRIAGA